MPWSNLGQSEHQNNNASNGLQYTEYTNPRVYSGIFFFNGEGEKGKFFFTIECQLISPMENTNTPCLLKGYFENNIAPPSVDFSSKMFHVNMKILFMLFIVT